MWLQPQKCVIYDYLSKYYDDKLYLKEADSFHEIFHSQSVTLRESTIFQLYLRYKNELARVGIDRL